MCNFLSATKSYCCKPTFDHGDHGGGRDTEAGDEVDDDANDGDNDYDEDDDDDDVDDDEDD